MSHSKTDWPRVEVGQEWVADLEAEVDRYREALTEIRDWRPSSGIPYKSAVVGFQQVATRALAVGGDPE